MSSHPHATSAYDLRNAVTSNRLEGLWRMMTGFRLPYLGATVSLAIAASARAAEHFLLRYFVDQVLAEKLLQNLWLVVVGFVALAALEGGFSFLSGWLAAYTSEGVTLRLRNYLFDHIQRLSFTYHDHTSTGELIERCTSDVDAVRRFFADQAIGMGRILSLFIISMSALLRLNVRLALLSVIAVPVLVLMSIFFFRRVSQAYEAMQEQEAVVSTTLQENLTGMRVVRAFARQDFERQKFQRDSWEKFLRGRRFMTMHSLYWPVSDTLCGFQTLFGIAVGAWMAMHGTISVGTYLAYTGLLIWVVWPIRNLGRLIVQMSSGLVSYERVAQVIAEKREPLTEGRYQPDGNVRGELVFDHVSFAYSSGYRALDDVSFRCEPGQVTALLGSTGSGKTTLVSLLPRFYDYTGGSVKLDGVELKDYPRHYLRRQIGIVEQEPFLFSRTIRENLTYGVQRKVTQDEIEAAARAAAIHDEIMQFPKGYDTLVGERGVMLSGGQKQRVAIARTLLKDPRILILDDATSSVDVETEHLIRQALQHLMRGRTTFIIAHRIQSVMNADLILVFDGGRIVQMGTHEELLQKEGIYRRIYELQTRVDVELEKEMAHVGVF
ncbi:MAG: ABC transporter ATP-binding protein [Chloroflexi bacterium]|nr:ABC transporter ATP-binding protein [Chloroflexota bacterium]